MRLAALVLVAGCASGCASLPAPVPPVVVEPVTTAYLDPVVDCANGVICYRLRFTTAFECVLVAEPRCANPPCTPLAPVRGVGCLPAATAPVPTPTPTP